MPQSPYPLDQVIVYDTKADAARWYTPNEASRLCNAWPTCIVIEESDPAWEQYRTLAGPKPIRFRTANRDRYRGFVRGEPYAQLASPTHPSSKEHPSGCC